MRLPQRTMEHDFQPRQSTGALHMRFHLAVAVLTSSLFLLTHLIEAAEYKYPYHDSYLATPTTAILSDYAATTRVKSHKVHLPGLAARNRLPSLEGLCDLTIS